MAVAVSSLTWATEGSDAMVVRRVCCGGVVGGVIRCAAPLLDVLDADQAVGDEAFQATLQPKVAAGLDLPSTSMCSKEPSAQLTRLI